MFKDISEELEMHVRAKKQDFKHNHRPVLKRFNQIAHKN